MKNLNIFILSIALVAAQACGPKSESSSDAEALKDATEKTAEATEKREKLEKQRAAQVERRRIALEELAKNTPYYTDANGVVVFYKADVNPSFEGGEEAMMKYLNDNIEFPKVAEERGLEATIFVDFIVGANGVVREVLVTDMPGEESDPSFRAEAVRVVTAMPNWVAGYKNGKPVDVRFNLPITFQQN
jgi:outer membrane biosynthesis protein TonB